MWHVQSGGNLEKHPQQPGQRLGVKRFGGQKVRSGEVLVRQTGSTKQAGDGTYMSRNFTIHAAKDGVVASKKSKLAVLPAKPPTAPLLWLNNYLAVTY